jgi:hypothetical protein
MNLLSTFADGGETRILNRSDNGDDEAIEAIELTKERYSFKRQIEFIPTVDGRHSLYIRVRDDFGNVTSIEKQVYSFTNMRPKLKVGYYANVHYDAGGGRDGVYHELDFSASYDRDSLYGGDIDSLFVLYKAVDFINAYPDQAIHGIGYDAVKVSDYIPGKGVHVGKYIVRPRDGLPDDGSGATEHFTDIYAWVKDNEGLVSDTVHIPIGHVENSVPRTEYEGEVRYQPTSYKEIK